MKWLLRLILVIIVAFGFQYTPISFSDDFYSVIYTIIGIMFSLAFSQIISFTFTEIQNDIFVKRQRERLLRIRTLYIVLFAFATIAFLLKSIKLNCVWKWIKLDIKYLIGSFLLFLLVYFIKNFISLAKLKYQIDDEIRKMKSKHEDDLL
jgi:hypothetical protein